MQEIKGHIHFYFTLCHAFVADSSSLEMDRLAEASERVEQLGAMAERPVPGGARARSADTGGSPGYGDPARQRFA